MLDALYTSIRNKSIDRNNKYFQKKKPSSINKILMNALHLLEINQATNNIKYVMRSYLNNTFMQVLPGCHC